MKQRLIIFSFVLSLLIMSAKFYAYYATGSTAVLTDALESIINVVAAAFAYYSVYLASLPRDLNHPYGHGKIEFFASGLEGVLILLAAAYIFLHASQHLIAKPTLTSMDLGLSVSLISAILNGLMGFYLVRAGKSSHSPALVADGKHLTLDAYNGVLIVAAIALTLFTDWIWVDGVASILFALLMCWQGIRLIREAVAALMDETNPAVFNKVIDWIMQHQKPTWIDLHNLRIQQYGGDLHIDCHLTLPRYWDLNRVHDEIHDFEVTMAEVFPTEIEIFVHVDPCLDACCSHCEILDCAIRSQAFTNKIEWNAKNMALNQKHFNEL
ncbi:cation diffusion facilitator family transporter [Aquirufa sp.]|jgi:cation diffusion facilitator family transporter|uniref:cation diffusion facilitator family transporter n=1 Tax=Aquirufa sp. TaxID=2676249 RepID=UPI0037BF8475